MKNVKNYRLFVLIILLMTALIFSLSACGKDDATEASAEVEQTDLSQPTTPTTDTTDPPTPTPSDFAMNPLTGVYDMSTENIDKKSMAIIVNNHRAAMPQRGVSQADMYYEYETEGGQTRLITVFADANTIPEMGSLRSARIVSVDLAGATESILVHFGANRRVPDHLTAHNVERIDGNIYCASSGQSVDGQIDLPNNRFFWRDSTWSQERATEHTAVTNGEQLLRAAEHTHLSMDGPTRVMFNFSDTTSALANAQTCNELHVYFSATNRDSIFEYNPSTRLYTKSQYGTLHIDESTGEPIQVSNIFVLFADIEPHGDSTVDIYLERGGPGYYATDGLIIPIEWEKDSPTSPFVFFDLDGNELEVLPGKSYINIVRSTLSDKTSYS